MDPVSFVKSLEIVDFDKPLTTSHRGIVTVDGKPQAKVDAGSLVSFVSELPKQKRQDVLYSTMLAQLAASKKYDRFEDPKNWYKFYQDVLANIGWSIQNFAFNKYHSKDQSFKLSEVSLIILETAIGADATVIKVLRKTLESLETSKDGIELYGSHSSSGNYGNFQVMPCTLDKSGQVNIASLVTHFKSKQETQNYFFFTWKSSDIDLSYAVETMTLNEDMYSRVREAIIKKLGKHAKDYIVDLEI